MAGYRTPINAVSHASRNAFTNALELKHIHLMHASKENWVPVCRETEDKSLDAYPDELIADWRRRHGFTD